MLNRFVVYSNYNDNVSGIWVETQKFWKNSTADTLLGIFTLDFSFISITHKMLNTLPTSLAATTKTGDTIVPACSCRCHFTTRMLCSLILFQLFFGKTTCRRLPFC